MDILLLYGYGLYIYIYIYMCIICLSKHTDLRWGDVDDLLVFNLEVTAKRIGFHQDIYG